MTSDANRLAGKVIHIGARKISPPSNIFMVCGR